MVYENSKANSYLEHVANTFDEVSLKNNHIIKFGVIDIRDQADMIHFLPFKFQYFPNIYTYLHNEDPELYSNLDQITPISIDYY